MPNSSKPTKAVWGYYALAVFVIIFDQITKHYFNNQFELGETLEIISPILNWTLAYNY